MTWLIIFIVIYICLRLCTMNEDKCPSQSEINMNFSTNSDLEPFTDKDVLMTTGAVARILKESGSLESTEPKVVENAAQSSESLLSEDRSSTESSAEVATCSTSGNLCWTDDSLHIFVLSEAGKPIYSRYGNESDLSSLMSVMQALVSFVANSGDELQLINTPDKKFLFVSRSHLILVAFSPVSEPTSHLRICLEYVYNQIISSLTLQRVEKQFTRHANLDLRKLLVGDNRLLSSIINRVEECFGIFLNAISCTPLSENNRAAISQIICQSAKLSGLVFGILFHGDDIVSIVRMKNQHLRPSDIHLLLNLIGSSQSFKSAQSHWLPICLPKFDANGFLYASVTYLNDSICMVLLSVDSGKFYSLKSITEKVFTLLNATNNGDYLSSIISSKLPQIPTIGIKNLRHFVYKSIPISQYITSEWTVPYAITCESSAESSIDTDSERKTKLLNNNIVHKLRHNVLLSYKRLHMRLHSSTIPAKFIYKITSTELFFGWKTDTFELYATLEPMVTITELGEIRKQLLKWIESKKTQFFILSYPTF